MSTESKRLTRREGIDPVGDRSAVEQGIKALLAGLGEDAERDGLLDTPRRVVNAFLEMTSGYQADIAKILGTTFEVAFDEMIAVRRIPFWSLCEHHLLPFHGHATVAYIPAEGGRVVGLSKMARVVHAYARRLQVQERMTQQIAQALEAHLAPRGVGVLVESVHLCMASRGVSAEAPMVTSYLSGQMRDDPKARAEFLALGRNP